MNETQIDNFLNKIEINYKEPNGCWLWVGCLSPKGYGVVNLNNRAYRSHRVAWEYWMKDEIPKDKVINHLCSVRNCVNPHHLEVVSQRENVRKAKTTRLTKEIADEIRAEYATGKYSQKELGKRHGVGHHFISAIVLNKNWK